MELPPVGMDSSADIAVETGHIQDIVGNTVDIVAAAADTIVQV